MTEPKGHDWRQLAEAARDEEDSSKLMELIRQLNQALDEAHEEPVSSLHGSGWLSYSPRCLPHQITVAAHWLCPAASTCM